MIKNSKHRKTFITIILIPSAPKGLFKYKESVELTFVYLIEGCGKTLSEINDTIPHTVVDMGYQGAECTYPHESTRSECCSVPSFR